MASIQTLARLIVVFILIAAASHGGMLAASAQDDPLDPRVLALTPSDISPDYSVGAEGTAYESLPDGVGVQFSTVMRRTASENGSDARPLSIRQTIVRLDRAATAAEFLTMLRDRLISERGCRLVPDVPNDATHASLVQPMEDDPNVGYIVFSVKNDMLIGVTVRGDPDHTTVASAVDLTRRIEGRYDALMPSSGASVVQPTPTAVSPAPQAPVTLSPRLAARCYDIAIQWVEQHPALGASKNKDAVSNVITWINDTCRSAATDWGDAGISCVQTALRIGDSSFSADVMQGVLKSCLSNLAR